MNNTIPNVPRKLLERVLNAGWGSETVNALDDLRDFLESAPSPAGVDGLVRNFKTREGYDVWDKLCAIPKFGFLIGPSGGVVKVADIGNWIDRDEAQSVVDEAQCEVNLLRHEASDAQAIIDGLRGELIEERAKVAQLEEGVPRIMEASYQFRQQRDQLAGLLREVHDTYRAAIHWEDLRSTMKRIDAVLSAHKDA